MAISHYAITVESCLRRDSLLSVHYTCTYARGRGGNNASTVSVISLSISQGEPVFCDSFFYSFSSGRVHLRGARLLLWDFNDASAFILFRSPVFVRIYAQHRLYIYSLCNSSGDALTRLFMRVSINWQFIAVCWISVDTMWVVVSSL